MPSDYYNLLGIPKNASPDDIRKAFRKKAKKYHPDANRNDPNAETRFKEINEAHEVLSDPQKRQQYDTYGANWRDPQQGNPQRGNPQRGNPQQGGNATVNPEDLQDMFNTFFRGGAASGGGFGGFGGAQRQAPRGQDIERSVQISLREAYEGTERLVTKDGRNLRVSIPAGATDGTKVKLAGEGAGGGDLYLVVEVEEDAHFKREGNDLHTEINVDVFTAFLGGEVGVPTLGKTLMLKIPPMTQSGKKFRLKEKGMPVLRQLNQHGDLYARVQIILPNAKALTDAQRAQIEQLRQSF